VTADAHAHAQTSRASAPISTQLRDARARQPATHRDAARGAARDPARERTVVTTNNDGNKPRRNEGMSRAELLGLPVTVDVGTAARALGLGRSTGYELARRGEFPCRILRLGSSYRVPTAELLRVLGIVQNADSTPPAT
jgi:excisionase family DNA binding protein